MARLMTRADGSPIHAHDGRPMYIEDICRPVEMVGTQCGHTYHLRGPVRLASSKDPTREDVVDEANRINWAAVARVRKMHQCPLCPPCCREDMKRLLDETDYRLNPDGRALGYERLFGSHEEES